MAVRSVLGEDLPLIGADVTVEHLLAHRSGIGDYLDESPRGSAGFPFPSLFSSGCVRAGMRDTGFLRSDALPDRTALGYLATGGEPRTNVFHLPVVGSGDGGIYSTAADVSGLWRRLFASKIVQARWVADMVRPRA